MTREVVITGRGVLSALGDSPKSLHAALVRGPDRECKERDGELAVESFKPESYLGERNLRLWTVWAVCWPAPLN